MSQLNSIERDGFAIASGVLDECARLDLIRHVEGLLLESLAGVRKLATKAPSACEFIPTCQLIHGANYAGTCRNASVARWNAADQLFYHWRHESGFKFVETIHAPEDAEKHDVFYETSVVEPKEDIPFAA